MKTKDVRLKNKYNGVVVYTRDYNDIHKVNEMRFIRVYDEQNPHRTYLANIEAFDIIKE